MLVAKEAHSDGVNEPVWTWLLKSSIAPGGVLVIGTQICWVTRLIAPMESLILASNVIFPPGIFTLADVDYWKIYKRKKKVRKYRRKWFNCLASVAIKNTE